MHITSTIINQHSLDIPKPQNSNLSLLERELGFNNVTTVIYKRDREIREVKSVIQKWLDFWGIK